MKTNNIKKKILAVLMVTAMATATLFGTAVSASASHVKFGEIDTDYSGPSIISEATNGTKQTGDTLAE